MQEGAVVNQHIRFFHALTGAGLSVYQAEKVVRAAGFHVLEELNNGAWERALYCCTGWGSLPGQWDDYEAAWKALGGGRYYL
jgi:hypothetical protein